MDPALRMRVELAVPWVMEPSYRTATTSQRFIDCLELGPGFISKPLAQEPWSE